MCLFSYSMLWLAAMDGRLAKDDTGALQVRRAEAFKKLRLGFAASIVSVALFVLSLFGLSVVFVAVPAVYFLGIYERASGWKLLGFAKTETTMWISAFFLAISPLGWVFVEFWSYSKITIDIVYLVPPALWGLYTAVESHDAGEVEKKLGLNLRLSRIFALCGILTVVVVYGFAIFSGIGSATFYLLPFNSLVFASPFLILSCVTFIRKLKLK